MWQVPRRSWGRGRIGDVASYRRQGSRPPGRGKQRPYCGGDCQSPRFVRGTTAHSVGTTRVSAVTRTDRRRRGGVGDDAIRHRADGNRRGGPDDTVTGDPSAASSAPPSEVGGPLLGMGEPHDSLPGGPTPRPPGSPGAQTWHDGVAPPGPTPEHAVPPRPPQGRCLLRPGHRPPCAGTTPFGSSRRSWTWRGAGPVAGRHTARPRRAGAVPRGRSHNAPTHHGAGSPRCDRSGQEWCFRMVGDSRTDDPRPAYRREIDPGD